MEKQGDWSNFSHLMLNTPLCKIYANSILSSLNARGGWRFNMHSLGEGTSQLAETTSHFQSFRIENDPNNLASNVMPGVAPRVISWLGLMPGSSVELKCLKTRLTVVRYNRPSEIRARGSYSRWISWNERWHTQETFPHYVTCRLRKARVWISALVGWHGIWSTASNFSLLIMLL